MKATRSTTSHWQSSNVKKPIKQVFTCNQWQDIAQNNWELTEAELRLSTWKTARRVVIFRRRVKEELLAVNNADDKQQVSTHASGW